MPVASTPTSGIISPDAPLSPKDAAALLLLRREARTSYAAFLKYWIKVTRQPFLWNWHFDYLCDIMQAVADRDPVVRFLIVNIPPRFAKSTIISQLWQAWMIGRENTRRSSLFSVGTSATLAARDSRRTLDILRSDWYRAVFSGVEIGAKETEAEWETAAGAYRIACGTGGTVIGRGADHICIAKGQRVLIRRGWVPIELVEVGDEAATPKGWRRVTWSGATGRKPTIIIETGELSLRLTPDHRCSTPEGWKVASALHGGFVHAIPEASPAMRSLREGDDAMRQTTVLQSVVFGTESLGGSVRAEAVRDVRKDVQATECSGRPPILFKAVLHKGDVGDVSWGEEPKVGSRKTCNLSRCIPKADIADANRRDREVPIVWVDRSAGGTSHRQEQDERFPGESSGIVLPVSSLVALPGDARGKDAACRCEPGTLHRESAEDARGEVCEVFDLTVEDAHCFYCEGILVHNCLDDPLKADEAGSELVRDQTNEWLGETLRSRLDDQKTGTITVVMQRLHELDPTGYLLGRAKFPGADQYHHIVIPNEATKRTVVQFRRRVYATREVGDLLHPDRIGPVETAALKAAMRANYDGQYQQEPSKMSGGMLDPMRLLRLKGTALELKSSLGLTPYMFLDLAATEKETQKDDPDYNVILVAAKDQLDRLILLDVWRKQTADHGIVARTALQMHKLYRPRFFKIEKGGLLNQFKVALSTQSRLMSHHLTIHPIAGRTLDKITRAQPFEGLLNAGLVGVPESAPWLPAFESEMRGFPRGSHDDQIDTASDASAEYPTMQRGETPTKDPDNEYVLADLEMKSRIEKAVAAATGRGESDDWHW